MNELILASQSPRRKHLLTEAGYKFRVDVVKVSEYLRKNVNIDQAIVECAQSKGQALVDSGKYLNSKGIFILSADTVVVFNGEPLGKPKSFEEAQNFLRLLSKKKHCVKTGVVVFDLDTKKLHSFVETTDVFFRELTDNEICEYVQSGEPMDKAGGYGIQGEAKKFVEKIDGSWSNVVGFPIEKFNEVVKKNGWRFDSISAGES